MRSAVAQRSLSAAAIAVRRTTRGGASNSSGCAIDVAHDERAYPIALFITTAAANNFFRGALAVRGFRTAAGHSSMATLVTSQRAYLVRFDTTPNDECMKFFIDEDDGNEEGFLREYLAERRAQLLQQEHSTTTTSSSQEVPPGAGSAAGAAAMTMSFDSTNSFQSPLADAIMSNLPMVEEVTIGAHFITVRRMLDDEYEVQLREALATEAQMSSTPMKPADVINGAMGACATREDGTSTCGDDKPVTASPSEANSSGTAGNGTITLDESQIRTLLQSAEWPELKLAVSAIIADHLYSGAPHITLDAAHPHEDTLPSSSDSELVAAIKELIATMIRPELQKDGGDIRFIGYAEDGNRMMSIELLGACKTCKSSKTTLQDLIERTTRHYIPEVLGIDAFVRKRGKMVSLLTGEPVPDVQVVDTPAPAAKAQATAA
jgi:Fe-S cluster biogenesis protein NfuA